ncbi:EamA family transporter RarD [Crenobacter sp. SG2303]|uniref:EamA family transporter RarD n=1 Tax=Crenobacter oryzisoli TaxID=3056844 RepID=A0ABT7XTR8_9NEIS|nr:EamA family transporter RarD [Crenobacter sp. SG2303]MDN0077192.1 EamA family transporter RarD [Crenobacter sp. SG2303]
MNSAKSHEAGQGALYAIGAYLCWGLFPLYWKPLSAVPAEQILGHRVVWSALLLAGVLTVRRHWGWLGESLRQPRRIGVFALSSALLSMNWLVYIWAVNHGRVVEASLGYFINPLVNVLLGRLVLGERLAKPQLAALGLAALGVLWLTLHVGSVPWVALVLAVTFALYGLLRKTAHLPSLEGLALETFLMAPIALVGLILAERHGSGAFGHLDILRTLLLIGAGVVTTVPLVLFASGARRLTLATLGVIQYLSPTLQFLLGVWLYHEPFDMARLIGFGLIWSGLALYTGAGLLRLYRR